MQKTNLNKRIVVLGHIALDGNKHQSKQVVSMGGYCQHSTPGSTKIHLKQLENIGKKIVIVGDLRVGGERGRIIHRKGVATSLSATEYKDPQKVIKRWKRKS